MTLTLTPIIPDLDLIALVYFLGVIAVYRLMLHRTGLGDRSLVGAVQRQRIAWMTNMAQRENRMLDAVLLGSLSQGNAFFASTSAIAVGGLATTVGSGEKVQSMLERLPFVAPSTSLMWELKLLLIMVVFIYAFFKFAWGFRLSHYTAIMIGATPLPTAEPALIEAHAVRTACASMSAGSAVGSGVAPIMMAV